MVHPMIALFCVAFFGTSFIVLGQKCPGSSKDVGDVCKFACNCSCSVNAVKYAACVAYCSVRLVDVLGGTPPLCDQLADVAPGSEDEICPVSGERRSKVCSKFCDCCGKRPDQCSCINAVDIFALRTFCSV